MSGGIDAIACYGMQVLYHGADVIIPYPSVDANGTVHAKIQKPDSISGNRNTNGVPHKPNGSTGAKERSALREGVFIMVASS